MTVAASLWLGPTVTEARAAYQRARERGMSSLRAIVIGNVASFRDCWAFRSKLAAQARCSVRTVSRALAQARELGLIGVARAKPTERPPGLDHVVPCGWSHRWTIGYGLAGRAVQRAVDAARARWMVRVAARTTAPSSAQPCKPARVRSPVARQWTAAELDAELARVQAPPPKPPPG